MLCIVTMHETGHYIAAKIMRLPIENVGFKLKPFPSFYVSIVDINIPIKKKVIFLLGGNFMTVLLFIVTLLLNLDWKIIYMAFAIQITNELNPFFSDYQALLFSMTNKKEIRQCILENPENSEKSVKDLYNEKYFLSTVWLIHFILWGIVATILLKSFIILKHPMS